MSRVRENRTHGSTVGSWKRSDLTTDTKKNDPTGNRRGPHGFVTYRQATPPRQLPTLRGAWSSDRFGVGGPARL